MKAFPLMAEISRDSVKKFDNSTESILGFSQKKIYSIFLYLYNDLRKWSLKTNTFRVVSLPFQF